MIRDFVADPKLAILCLGFNRTYNYTISNNFKVVHDTQTASCYIIKPEYIPKLMEVFEISIRMFEYNLHIKDRAIDKFWKKLQTEINFVIPEKRVVYQLESYSDIQKKKVSYGF